MVACAGLSDLAAVAEEEADAHLNDPLTKLDLEQHLVQQLQSLYHGDSTWFQSLCSSMTQDQIQTIKSIFGQS